MTRRLTRRRGPAVIDAALGAVTTLLQSPSLAAPSGSGVANTPGAWVEFITAGTIATDFLILGFMPAPASISSGIRCDIGVGAAGSEAVVGQAIWRAQSATPEVSAVPVWLPVPILVPAGSRVALRVAYSTSSTTGTNPRPVWQPADA